MPENLERAAMLKRTRIAAETMERYAERLVIQKAWRLRNREKLRTQKREAYKNDPNIKAAQQKYKKHWVNQRQAERRQVPRGAHLYIMKRSDLDGHYKIGNPLTLHCERKNLLSRTCSP